MDRYQCFVCAECILGVLTCTFLFSGSILVSYRWKPTYDDRAQKTWASGDCLIIDHSHVKNVGTNDAPEYNAYLRVQLPFDLDAETFDNGTAVDFRRAFKWPHQAETEDFDTEKEANRFQESHPIDTVSTCFWDPKKPSKVAMTNRGGDWTGVWIGTSMLVFCVPLMGIVVLLNARGARAERAEWAEWEERLRRRPARAERAERAESEEERRRAGTAEAARVEADRAKMIRAVIATATAEARRLNEQKRAEEEGVFGGMFKMARTILGESDSAAEADVELSRRFQPEYHITRRRRQQPGAVSFEEMRRTLQRAREWGLPEETSACSALSSACNQLGLISDGSLEQNAARCYKYLYLAGVDVTLAAGIDFEIIEIETL